MIRIYHNILVLNLTSKVILSIPIKQLDLQWLDLF